MNTAARSDIDWNATTRAKAQMCATLETPQSLMLKLRSQIKCIHESAALLRQIAPVDAKPEASNLVCGVAELDELLRDMGAALAMAEAG